MNESALQSALRAAAKTISKSNLLELARMALRDMEVRDATRNVWSIVTFVLDPQLDPFDGEQGTENVAAILTEDRTSTLISALCEITGVEQRIIRGLTVRVLGARVTPGDDFSHDGRVTEPQRLSETVRNAINALAGDARSEAGKLLQTLAADPTLLSWKPSIQHAHAQQLRLQRDRRFKHSTAVSIREAL